MYAEAVVVFNGSCPPPPPPSSIPLTHRLAKWPHIAINPHSVSRGSDVNGLEGSHAETLRGPTHGDDFHARWRPRWLSALPHLETDGGRTEWFPCDDWLLGVLFFFFFLVKEKDVTACDASGFKEANPVDR